MGWLAGEEKCAGRGAHGGGSCCGGGGECRNGGRGMSERDGEQGRHGGMEKNLALTYMMVMGLSKD